LNLSTFHYVLRTQVKLEPDDNITKEHLNADFKFK